MRNTIYIVGIGPGKTEKMTVEAHQILQQCDVIVGYSVYIELLKPHFSEKEFLSTPMTREVERCKLCFEQALQGKKIALVCSGDAGVYGMASLMFELKHAEKQQAAQYAGFELCVIAGVTAANSGAALLGAPLSNDYCVISLSDVMTPWQIIEKRLACAVKGDFAIAIYNPSSRTRKDHLKRACHIMLEAGASPNLPCGYVENIGRDGTAVHICTLAELAERQVNMFTTVFVGNSQTFVFDGKLITRRGYSI